MGPADRYQAVLLDLDGVLYRGDQAIPGAGQTVARLRALGKELVFLTNNSARTPEQVAGNLAGMGIPVEPAEVMTSAQATAEVVARDIGSERPPTAFVVGEEGVRSALAAAGLEVLDGDPPEAGFVVIGWDRRVTYDKLRRASLLVRSGARLVATNADATYPAPGGELWPGAGALVAAVETAAARRATVVGKPHPPLFQAAVRRAGTDAALVVGDRLETDIAGAASVGLDGALVLTGAAGLEDLLAHDHLPVTVLRDLRGLLEPGPVVRIEAATTGEQREAVRSLVGDAGLRPEEGEATMVAGDDGEVLGTAAAEVRDGDAYLHSVAVREQLRRRHVGALAVAGAARRAVAAGARHMFLLTEGADRFFARLGFRGLERRDLPAWVIERSQACAETAVAMARPLG